MTITKATWPLTTTFHLRNKIDTNPDYQRPSVWSVSQKQLLMDTILRGYDIPKLYLRKTSSNPDKYEVVDGQQRLRPIWSFMSNEFALPKDADSTSFIEFILSLLLKTIDEIIETEKKVTVKVTQKVTVNQKKIIEGIKKNPFITQEELSQIIGLSRKWITKKSGCR